jgi:hypothetical protein
MLAIKAEKLTGITCLRGWVVRSNEELRKSSRVADVRFDVGENIIKNQNCRAPSRDACCSSPEQTLHGKHNSSGSILCRKDDC